MVVEENVKLSVENVSLNFGGIQALQDVSLKVTKGSIHAIIGPNGAGKTSLLNCISGFYKPTSGHIYVNNQDITRLPPHKIPALGIGRTFQNIELFIGLTTLDNLLAGRHIQIKPGILSSAIYFGLEHKKDLKNRRVVEEIIDFLEIEAIRKKIVGTLPYGQRKRVELGRALAVEPEILLLDEPLAGMNMEEKEDMARFILDVNEEKDTTIVVIEHDMEFVMDIADHIVVLDFGRKIAEGTPNVIVSNPDVIKAYLGVA